MQIAAIIALIQAVVTAAPQIEGVVSDLKNYISSLATRGLISTAQQNAVHAYVDAVAAAAASGNTPPEFTVEADPA